MARAVAVLVATAMMAAPGAIAVAGLTRLARIDSVATQRAPVPADAARAVLAQADAAGCCSYRSSSGDSLCAYAQPADCARDGGTQHPRGMVCDAATGTCQAIAAVGQCCQRSSCTAGPRAEQDCMRKGGQVMPGTACLPTGRCGKPVYGPPTED